MTERASKRRIIVAMTGATGAVYGLRLLQELRRPSSTSGGAK
jgi:3-polyprenyl-4-hydroxybenzoate decarboxylase